MDRQERACPRADRCSRRGRIESVVGGGNLDRDGHAAGLRDRLEGRDEGERRHDHLVAGLERQRDQREAERVEPARDPDAVGRAGVRRERRLERGDRRPVRERARLEQLGDVAEHLVGDRRVNAREVEERDGGTGPGSRHLPHGSGAPSESGPPDRGARARPRAGLGAPGRPPAARYVARVTIAASSSTSSGFVRNGFSSGVFAIVIRASSSSPPSRIARPIEAR